MPSIDRRSLLTGFAALSAVMTSAWASEPEADVVIAGAGVGGVAAALALLRNGLRVHLVEETDWIGGQFSQQGVPPDEHGYIEEPFGASASYAAFRRLVRRHYRGPGDVQVNPGQCFVSRLCFEPRVAVNVMLSLLAPYVAAGRCSIALESKVDKVEMQGDRVVALRYTELPTLKRHWLRSRYVVDATELGDILELAQVEHVIGAEAQSDTGEPHAPALASPADQQAFTVCFAMDYAPDGNHTIDRPDEYAFWRDYVPRLTPPWPGQLLSLTYSSPTDLTPRTLDFDPTGASRTGRLNLWNYRRLIHGPQFPDGRFATDISLVNWPQNDYLLGPLVGVSAEVAADHVRRAKQLSLSLLYWLQTEVPRADGKGHGYPSLRLRPDVMGTSDGLAKYPYVREARRITPLFRVLEQHVTHDAQHAPRGPNEVPHLAEEFADSVGIGSYPIDLHPSPAGRNYIDIPTRMFQIPLGALLPIRVENLLPAAKNIGTTHITNGCFRLHPVEWAIGEAVGCLIVFAARHNIPARAVRDRPARLEEFQNLLASQGVPIKWPWPRS